MHIVRILLNT